MNHIFKVVFNKATGLINVVSEKSKNSHKVKSIRQQSGQLTESQRGEVATSQFKKNILSRSTALVLISLISTGTFAQQIYDGTATGIQLETTGDFGWGVDEFFNQPDLKGVVLKYENGATMGANTNILIDSSTLEQPDFVISGYGALFAADKHTTSKTVENNSLTMRSGGVKGDLYAGLAHITRNIPDQDCLSVRGCNVNDSRETSGKVLVAQNNTIEIEGADLTLNDLYVGYSTIHSETGNFNFVSTFYNLNSNGIKNNTQISAINYFNLSGKNNIIKNIYSGLTLNDNKNGDLNVREMGGGRKLSRKYTFILKL